MYPKGTQKYVAPSYAEVTDEKMRNYKKILHQSQWEVQSKLSVIKVRPGPQYQVLGSCDACLDVRVEAAGNGQDCQLGSHSEGHADRSGTVFICLRPYYWSV